LIKWGQDPGDFRSKKLGKTVQGLKSQKNIWLPFIAAIGANVIWGSTFLASKKVLAIAPPFTAIAIRFSIAIFLLFLVGLLKKNNYQMKLLKENGADLLRLGVLSYTVLYAVQMYGLKYISSAQSAVIMMLAPIFTVLFESIRTSNVSKMDSLSVLTGFAGAFVLIKSTYNELSFDYSLIGFLLTLVASICLSYSVILTKKLHEKSQSKYSEKLSIFNLTFATMVIGTIGILPFSFFEVLSGTMNFSGISSEFYLWSLYLGIICSVLAFLSWNWAIIYANPVVTAVSMYLKTPVAILLAAVFLAEQLNHLFYLGFLLILVPLFLKQLLTIRLKV
jgi:drug/metabolite transporter (DMT)-like permease